MSSFDITFCPNKTCTKRANCERNSDRLKDYPYPVSMAGFQQDENGDCEYYVPMDEESEKKKNYCETCIHAYPRTVNVILGGKMKKQTKYLCGYSGTFEENSWTCAGYKEKEVSK